MKTFAVTVADFREDYISNGPMVQGIEPNIAMERLKKYKASYGNFRAKV